jgi:metal-sulfur cluster biosynthetic enzyme
MSTWDSDHFLRPDIDYVMRNFDNDPDEITQLICSQIETVYDPEFPIVDVFTLGLLYSIVVDNDEQMIEIIMTYTTPSCPEGELIQQLIKNAISDKLPTYTTNIQITFDPQRSLDMIRDQDLRRMFE